MLRKIVHGFALVGVVLGVGALGAGCLDRPITAAAPTIKTNFTSAVNQTGIDKVDILFDIDNSASMGDKQAYLIQAIPQMIARLVTPDCIDDKTMTATGQHASATDGTCPAGSAPEFSAVHDMHIGVVTSSLGERLGIAEKDPNTGAITAYVCQPESNLVSAKNPGVMFNAYNDDQGHLINRTGPLGSGPPLPNATLGEGGGFLYWFPALNNTDVNPVIPTSQGTTLSVETSAGTAATDGTYPSGTLIGDFSELIQGVGESGCGIESQLESWYRFLIQPDPYASIILGGAGGQQATWSGVDTTIIQQRHDFLRPDSLVAVIVLTDENDSEIDVRSFQGSGYDFMSDTFSPNRATAICFTNPNDPGCMPCNAPGAPANDPSCSLTGGVYNNAQTHDWGFDLNLRHVHMMQKYDLNPQFPLTRYYNGLTSPTVPNRFGEYPSASGGYAGNNNCTNPLFAKVLPQASDVPDAMNLTPAEVGTAAVPSAGALCALPGGSVRTPADVFYAHIGGVPHQLLQSTTSDGTGECPPTGHTAGTPPSGTTCGATQYWDTSVSPNVCADCPQKNILLPSDWVSILGKGPASYSATNTSPANLYDYTGIDPHMVESQTPRNVSSLTNPIAQAGLTGPCPTTTAGGGSALPCPGIPSGGDPIRPDPINGREWTTTASGSPTSHSLLVDREYACIFQLPPSSQRDCAAIPDNTIEENSCDCTPQWVTGGAPTTDGGVGTDAGAGPVAKPTLNSPDEIPPLCSKTSTDGTITSAVNDYTVQTHAKAYPTIRELTLANMMGAQGIVSSLCPIHTVDNDSGDDPLYGYRPAVNAIVNRLKNALGAQCVPALTPDSTGNVPCLVLVTFGPTVSGAPTSESGCASYGAGAYSEVDPTVLAEFKQSEATAAGDGGVNMSKYVTCELNQSPVPPGENCAMTGGKAGWCYVTGAGITGGSTCTQQISYSNPNIVPNGATISLQCISTNTASADGGAKKGDGG